MTTKKKNRLVKATLVMTVNVLIDRDTEPEDIFHDQGLTLKTEHGLLSSMKLVHTAVTAIKKVK